MARPAQRRIIEKFFKRALWMNDPKSLEFQAFFLEMVTEIRQASGRQFNADFTLEDVKRALVALTQGYPAVSNISLNTVLKTVDTLTTLGKIGDMFNIAMAVSIAFMPLTLAVLGPLPYFFFRMFASERLKCGAIFAVGGLLASEIYSEAANASTSLPGKKKKLKNQTVFQFNYDERLDAAFRLDAEEARFLLSLEYSLALSNLEATTLPEIQSAKRIWLDDWKRSAEESIGHPLITEPDQVKKGMEEAAVYLPLIKVRLLFLETVLFEPFKGASGIPAKEKSLKPEELDAIAAHLHTGLTSESLRLAHKGAVDAIGQFNAIKNLIATLLTPTQMPFGIRIIEGKPEILRSARFMGKNDVPEFIIGGGLTAEPDMAPFFVKAAGSDSGFVLKELARMEVALKRLFTRLSDYRQVVSAILEKQKALRGELIRLLNTSGTKSEEMQKSLQYIEAAIRRNEEYFKKNG